MRWYCTSFLQSLFVIGALSSTAVYAEEPIVLRDNFDQSSCLQGSSLASQLNEDGDFVLTMQNAQGQGLLSATELSYGRYTARIKTDIGGGAIVAFYVMGVDNWQRNNPFYHHLHDEIDFELVSTLWREGQHIAQNATWINAYAGHESIVLPKRPGDDAGGSFFALAEKISNDENLFYRHVLPDLDMQGDFWGHNFNDGQYYTYSFTYTPNAVSYEVRDDDDKLIQAYQIDKSSSRWPKAKMYVALTIWTASDVGTQTGFSGVFDKSFPRPMRAYVDYLSYAPSPEAKIPKLPKWKGRIPWRACGY